MEFEGVVFDDVGEGKAAVAEFGGELADSDVLVVLQGCSLVHSVEVCLRYEGAHCDIRTRLIELNITDLHRYSIHNTTVLRDINR